MVVAMNSIPEPGSIYTPTHIEALCDLVANPKRDEKDFQLLLHLLEQMPKECTPFKGKILQHLQIHALGNPKANLKLLANCFARATLLFRKTPNKSDGPLGAWKSGLSSELRNLEQNLNQLYGFAGVNTNNIIGKDNNNTEDDDLISRGKLNESKADFESIINEHLLKVNWAANNVCALISSQTEFNIPIPVQVLLRLSSKIGSLRWRDYKKKPNGLIKTYVFTLTPYLIEINLRLFKSIITVLGTNVIPFMPAMNQAVIRALEWTRSSNLYRHEENLYHSIRSQLLKMITFIAEQLSLHMNLEPHLLKVMLEVELVDELMMTPSSGSNGSLFQLRDNHMVDALTCLENLIIIYSNFLDAQLESKIKNYVIQTCIKVYRDFESDSMSLVCRRQLLNLLQTIANQPYATSTTEVAHHIFELAEKLEYDPEIRSVARRALKLGLAHRPTIVTHYDVYNCYNRPMSVGDLTTSDSPANVEELVNGDRPVEGDCLAIADGLANEVEQAKDDEQTENDGQAEHDGQTNGGGEVNGDGLVTTVSEPEKNGVAIEEEEAMQVHEENGAAEEFILVHKKKEATAEVTSAQDSEDDEKVLSVMSFFVEKLA